jgi:hypothetical protein
VADFKKKRHCLYKNQYRSKKIGTIYLKFDEKIRIDQIRFFSTHQIFKHWLVQQSSMHGQGNQNLLARPSPRGGVVAPVRGNRWMSDMRDLSLLATSCQKILNGCDDYICLSWP